ncbi:MAG: tetratricopeptide repeat protein [Proteobacteria bacterium]|nr:tetratricopeptide repeat protein [Pseudomonadota bacterium]MDA1325271.1 tetratricopeptide repeat protein [Pseudomonadota bacterium]
MLRILTVLMAISAASPVMAAESAGNECDQLAAHPYDPARYDPARQVRGVVFDAIDPARAVTSCAAAFSEQPGVVRFMYQYGRTLLAAKRGNEAMVFIRSAANSGYAAAQQSLATMLYEDESPPADKIEAIRLFHKAAAQGHAVAQLRVASFYLLGEGGLRDMSKAERFARQAADQGLPAARTALEMIAGVQAIK